MVPALTGITSIFISHQLQKNIRKNQAPHAQDHEADRQYQMLRHYVGNRKKGHIFIDERTGKRLIQRNFEKMVDARGRAAEYP